LKTLLTRGTASARTLSRARILDLLHPGQAPADIASRLQVTPQTVFNVKRRFLDSGLQAARLDQPRSGRPVEIDGQQRAKITALACSTPPAGRARWTRRLRELIAHHGAQDSKKNELQPHLKKTWCISKLDAALIARLEQILYL